MKSDLSFPGLPKTEVPLDTGGPLAGRTVLRFAHAYDSGGGTERYLDDLDHALLGRSAVTIIRLHLSREPGGRADESPVGRGKLVRIGLPVPPRTDARSGAPEDSVRFRIKQKLRDWTLYNPLVWSTVGAKWAASRSLPRRAGEAVGAGAAAARAMGSRKIDVAILHFFGGSDADEIISQARLNRVPFALLNHYSNDRFLHLAIRKHAMLANGVSGVNGLQVPRYLRSRFTNLSDGIDTEFFSAANARRVADKPPGPIVLLPARVVREKGQLDLVRAVASLRDEGIRCSLVFAGTASDPLFLDELRSQIARSRLGASTRFLGNASIDLLRDWYAASSVVAFPTYHHEGLGRVIVEAQAMGTPVVAYGTGGVPDAIIEGRTGFLVRTGDLAGLTRRLRQLLSSDALRLSMAVAGRQAAERQFSLRALAERHEAFYLRIAAGKAS